MKYLKKYNNCIYCNSKKIKKLKNQIFIDNFYLKAIRDDLKITTKFFKKMKVYECENCKIIQNNPWFNENISRRIYSNIYGQHNRSWSNLINYFNRNKLPNHGDLFEKLIKNIKIKKYAEFNSPFMGIFLNFFSKEYPKNNSFLKKLLKNAISYLSSRQVAGKSKRSIKLLMRNTTKYSKIIFNVKKKNLLRKRVKKYLFIDNSPLCWGQNDNYKSVNSRSLATELFDLEIVDRFKKNSKLEIDLFGIFHTLDHTFKPNKILNFALNTSKYVIVYCHVDKRLEKQHLFSITNEFLQYLNKNKIYTLNLTNKINKKYKSPELYFLCSNKKKFIDKIKL
tara:strand:+ start:1495 stop:2505 length:1011 start_codon:yes stop_codon:yes gene_type:complete